MISSPLQEKSYTLNIAYTIQGLLGALPEPRVQSNVWRNIRLCDPIVGASQQHHTHFMTVGSAGKSLTQLPNRDSQRLSCIVLDATPLKTQKL